MNPTLVILAAGIGSRFGGLKQVEPLGPNGEFIIDYSIFDALRAGFGKVVIVIRKEMEDLFEELFSSRFRNSVDTEFVFQDLHKIPQKYSGDKDRKKPWGTGHAVLACSEIISEPFCVINADDFYGRSSYKLVYNFLEEIHIAKSKAVGNNSKVQCGLVGYELKNTLSDHGSVSRGICEVSPNGYLKKLVERTKVKKSGEHVVYHSSENNWVTLRGDELVSVNLWGFMPEVFESLQSLFEEFLENFSGDDGAEFFVTTAIDELIKQNRAEVAVLNSKEKWFGVTHNQDITTVKSQILKKVKTGDYPEKLWN